MRELHDRDNETVNMPKENHDDLTKTIDTAVDNAVDKAFRKYGGYQQERSPKRKKHFPKGLLAIILIVILVAAGSLTLHHMISKKDKKATPVESHDLTLENHKIFGYKAVDFAKPILEQAKQENLLIVEERDASVNTTATSTGLFNLGVFTKTQVMTFHGTGTYTVDLSKITQKDISLDDYVLTVKIPHAELHSVTLNTDQTEIGDVNNGWLSFGNLKLTEEQHKKIETEGTEKLKISLSSDDSMADADRFAKLTTTEELQKIVSVISPVCRVQVQFDDEGAENEAESSVESSNTASSGTSNP